MEYKVEFKCVGENLEEIPESIIKETGLRFPEVHRDRMKMAILSKELKLYKKDILCRVPFCVTVEAEALGGDIKLGDEKTGPRVASYTINSVEDLEKTKEIDLNSGRIKEVLEAVKMLNNENEIVALSVEGPFTIVSSLMDPMFFYKTIRKNREAIDYFLKGIEDGIVKYILEGIRQGAKIISYGDPVGSLDIVGPKMYEELSGKITYNIIKRVESKLEGAVLHLCGKTSTAFEKLGFSKSVPVEFEEGYTYGQAIEEILKNRKEIKIIGNSCIKRTPFKMEKPIVWSIELV